MSKRKGTKCKICHQPVSRPHGPHATGGSVTGRLSSSAPNMQFIPREWLETPVVKVSTR